MKGESSLQPAFRLFFSRRKSTLFLALMALIAAPAAAQTTAQATISKTTSSKIATSAIKIQARSADKFVDSMGINVHVESTNFPYSKYDLVNSSLKELGMRHFRDEMNAADPAFHDNSFIKEVQDIGALNYTLCGVIEGGNDYPTTPAGTPGGRLEADRVVPMITSLVPVIDAVEGPNEPDGNTNPPFEYNGVCDPKAGETKACYPDGAISESEDLWHIVKHSSINGSEEIKGLPVLGMSEANSADFLTLANITGTPFAQASYGNMHAYQAGLQGDWNLTKTYIPNAQAWTGTKPLWTTEMGYHNYTLFLSDQEQQGVSERAAAIYLPIAFLSGFNRHVERTFSYELFDEIDDPHLEHKCDVSSSGVKYCSGEGHYGLLNYDGTPKPAFTALQNLIEILREPESNEFTPGTLDVHFSNAPATMEYSLLQKSNGDYYLAIWNDEKVFDLATSATHPGRDIHPKNMAVTIHFCMPRSFTVYAPNDDSGADPTNSYTSSTTADSIEIDLPAKVLLIKVVSAN